MAEDHFWSGFGLGTLTGVVGGVAAFVAASGRASSHDDRILRLESSIQIGRPVEEVFAEWSKFESLPEKIRAIQHVAVSWPRSNWQLKIGRRSISFCAETEQLIPNQAIG